MALLDDISKAVTNTGKEAAQKAKDMAELVQLKAQLSAQKNRLKSLYEAVGQLYYKKHRNDAEGDYQMIIDEITKLLAQMEEARGEIRKLEGSVVCPSCGAIVKKGNKFCGKCGAAIAERQEEESAEAAPAGDPAAEAAGEGECAGAAEAEESPAAEPEPAGNTESGGEA